LVEPPGPPRPDDEAETDPDFSPACDEPDVVDPSHAVAEWEAMSQDHGPFEIPGLVAVWVSDPAGDWDGPFVGNVRAIPCSWLSASAAPQPPTHDAPGVVVHRSREGTNVSATSALVARPAGGRGDRSRPRGRKRVR
jgi:hypothetical protein